MNVRRRSLCAAGAGLLIARSPVIAQVQDKVYRLGYLSPRATHAAIDDAFLRGMRELGYSVGRNLVIEYRWAGNDLNRLQPLADELVQIRVDLIVTASTPGTRAAMSATRTIPIVIAAAAEPVAAGLVASLGRPGGNVTGMSLQTTDVARKRLQLMREILPGATRVGLLAEQLTGPTQGTTKVLVQETQTAAKQIGVALVVSEIAHGNQLEDAFAQYRREQIQALIVQASPLTVEHGKRIVELAARERLPAMYETRDFVDDGGFVSYGPDLRDSYRRAAMYVHRIFNGASPGDLPIEQPDKMELVINMRTAKQLDISVSQALLVRAETVP